MRSRVTAGIVLCVLLTLFAAPNVANASAPGEVVIAQEADPDAEAEGGEGQNEGGEGSSSESAESGADEGQTEGATTEEEAGPPWTYQMAWITLALLLFLGLAMAYLYYRLVVTRRRGVA